jgi:hypothetical protein
VRERPPEQTEFLAQGPHLGQRDERALTVAWVAAVRLIDHRGGDLVVVDELLRGFSMISDMAASTTGGPIASAARLGAG